MARPLQRDKWAEAVFNHIPSTKDEGEWISVAELARLTGLKPGQVQDGVRYLRENFPTFPLISSTAGYRFSLDDDEVMTFGNSRARDAGTRIKLTYNGAIKPYAEQKLGSRAARLIGKQFERAIEDIEELLAV